MNKAAQFSYTWLVTLSEKPSRILSFFDFELEMLSFLVGLKFLVISIFLNPTVIAGDGQVLKIVIEEGSLNKLDMLIFATREDLVSLFLIWAIILFRLSLIIPDMDIFDVTIFMAK